MSKKRFGIGTLGCMSVIVGLIIFALFSFIGDLLLKPNISTETGGMLLLGVTCSIMVFVGAGIIMMIIGFIRRSREKAIEAEADRIVRINEKVEEKLRNKE